MVVLDTDHLSLLVRGESAAGRRLQRRLDKSAAGGVVATIISYEEQMRGWLSYLAKSRSMEQQIDAYKRLHGNLINFQSIQLLDFDESAAVQFQRIQKLRLRVGTMDLKIAAITIANDGLLLTRNLSDFKGVPGLKVEDWTT